MSFHAPAESWSLPLEVIGKEAVIEQALPLSVPGRPPFFPAVQCGIVEDRTTAIIAIDKKGGRTRATPKNRIWSVTYPSAADAPLGVNSAAPGMRFFGAQGREDGPVTPEWIGKDVTLEYAFPMLTENSITGRAEPSFPGFTGRLVGLLDGVVVIAAEAKDKGIVRRVVPWARVWTLSHA